MDVDCGFGSCLYLVSSLVGVLRRTLNFCGNRATDFVIPIPKKRIILRTVPKQESNTYRPNSIIFLTAYLFGAQSYPEAPNDTPRTILLLNGICIRFEWLNFISIDNPITTKAGQNQRTQQHTLFLSLDSNSTFVNHGII